MSIFEIVASVASVISLVFAAFVYHRERLRIAREEGKVFVFRERLGNVETSLRATATSLQMLIRRADNSAVEPAELQNIARAVRNNLLGAILETREIGAVLRNWKFGELVKSDNEDIEKNIENEEEAM